METKIKLKTKRHFFLVGGKREETQKTRRFCFVQGHFCRKRHDDTFIIFCGVSGVVDFVADDDVRIKFMCFCRLLSLFYTCELTVTSLL